MILCFSYTFLVNSLTLSPHRVNKKSQAMKKVITMEVKIEIVEKFTGGLRVLNMAAADYMLRAMVSTIVKKKKDIIG